MNKEQALNILEQALNAASAKGVFGLQDSATILTALQVLKQTEEKPLPQYDLEQSKGKLATHKTKDNE